MPLLFYEIVVNSKKDSKIGKKNFPLVYRACLDKSIDIYNILHFDQYSRLAIRLWIFFSFRPLIRKRIWNSKKKLTISLQNSFRGIHWWITSNIWDKNKVSLFFWISWYKHDIQNRRTDEQTDKQTDGINFRMHSQRPFEWYMTRLSSLKINWRRGKQ